MWYVSLPEMELHCFFTFVPQLSSIIGINTVTWIPVLFSGRLIIYLSNFIFTFRCVPHWWHISSLKSLPSLKSFQEKLIVGNPMTIIILAFYLCLFLFGVDSKSNRACQNSKVHVQHEGVSHSITLGWQQALLGVKNAVFNKLSINRQRSLESNQRPGSGIVEGLHIILFSSPQLLLVNFLALIWIWKKINLEILGRTPGQPKTMPSPHNSIQCLFNEKPTSLIILGLVQICKHSSQSVIQGLKALGIFNNLFKASETSWLSLARLSSVPTMTWISEGRRRDR